MFSTLEKRPRNIMVCGHEVRVHYRKRMSNHGEFYPDEKLIRISNDDNWREHLLHELMHAIFFFSGHSEKMTPQEEEGLVRALENGIKTLTFL